MSNKNSSTKYFAEYLTRLIIHVMYQLFYCEQFPTKLTISHFS